MKNYSEHNINGKIFTIRPPVEKDAGELSRFINKLSKEKVYTLMQGERTTKKKELDHIKKVRKNIQKKKGVWLLMFCGEELVGMANIKLRPKIYRHTGNLGILIKKEFRGQKLGAILIKKIMKESSHLTGIKKIILQVFKNNIPAINLYKKFGFKEYGYLPRAIKWRNKYMDEVLMYKDVK